MRLGTFECARCEAGNQVFFIPDQLRHLRRCESCKMWHIINKTAIDSPTDVGIEAEIRQLGEPPTRPIKSCDETVTCRPLPQHIINEHANTALAPETD